MLNTKDGKNVYEMYVEKDTLSPRINLHKKYSVNKLGWANWVFDQYELCGGMNVLELASGTAEIWHDRKLPENIKITLSDFSPLMVEKAKNLLSDNPIYSFRQIDIQDIPYGDNIFDMVIANHMLYHVPDTNKALSEVRRVLKPEGCFYATTIGKESYKELESIYRRLDGKNGASFSYTGNISFTLENGGGILNRYFNNIEKRYYEDSLEVTDTEDLISYILSYNKVPQSVLPELRKYVEEGFDGDGIFRITKEQGMFVCINK